MVYKVYNGYKFNNQINWAVEQRKGALTMGLVRSTQQGLQDGWTRATFILRRHHLEKLKALAYWERRTIKEVIDEALGSYLKGKDLQRVVTEI